MSRTTAKIATVRELTLVLALLSVAFLFGCELGMDSALEECNVTPSSLDFGAVSLGAHSDMSFIIENLGTGSLSGNVTEDSIYYSVFSGGGSFELGEGQSMAVVIRFEPAVGGRHECTVDLGTRCGGVACTGTGGTGPICEVNPQELDFGEIPVGSVFGRSFNIRNVGDGILTGYVTEDSDDFEIVEGAGIFNLARNQALSVGVRFEPTSVGTKTATILTGTDCASVECTGNATLE